jgi:hypothetical protein
MDEAARAIAELVKAATRVLFITGTGVSAESGRPTFRGATGAFADGLTEEGIHFEEALSGPTLLGDLRLAWKYFCLNWNRRRASTWFLGRNQQPLLLCYESSDHGYPLWNTHGGNQPRRNAAFRFGEVQAGRFCRGGFGENHPRDPEGLPAPLISAT